MYPLKSFLGMTLIIGCDLIVDKNDEEQIILSTFFTGLSQFENNY
jgi:hypothetical protein